MKHNNKNNNKNNKTSTKSSTKSSTNTEQDAILNVNKFSSPDNYSLEEKSKDLFVYLYIRFVSLVKNFRKIDVWKTFITIAFLVFGVKMVFFNTATNAVARYHPQDRSLNVYHMNASNEDKESLKVRRDWRYWTETLNRKEIIAKWFNYFNDVRYKRAGVTEKFKTADCVDAVYYFLRRYGYKGTTRNVQGTLALCKKFNKAGLLDFRKKSLRYRDVKAGDLIFFKPNKRGIPHIGVVTGYVKKRGQVMYVDMNGTKSMGLTENISWNNHRIDRISEVSWALFSSDYLEELETKRIEALKHK